MKLLNRKKVYLKPDDILFFFLNEENVEFVELIVEEANEIHLR